MTIQLAMLVIEMDQIRANSSVPTKANLMTDLLGVQMSWGNGRCTRAGSPGDQQTRDFGPWDARRFRAMMRAKVWGHDVLKKQPTYWRRPHVPWKQQNRLERSAIWGRCTRETKNKLFYQWHLTNIHYSLHECRFQQFSITIQFR